MTIFITGATGFIGQRLAFRLADEGNTVVALVRNLDKASSRLKHSNIILVKGNMDNTDSLCSAMKNCEAVYHLAALASVWHRDPDAFKKSNVDSVERILKCCLKLGIKDFVFTSSAGVAGHSYDGEPVREYSNLNPFLETDYERSKVDAELLVRRYCAKGLRGIIVNPSRVYGPGLLTESNGVTRLIKMYMQGRWHILPGRGQSIGNYVFIDDVVSGLILAMERAGPGERYLLGGENSTFSSFFQSIDKLTGRRHWLLPFPLSWMLIISKLSLFIAENTGRRPLITPPFVRKYHKHWIVSSEKAISELDYRITPLEIGLKKTVEWLQKNDTSENLEN